MDNLTHTLAGALLAECGLKQRSRLAYPALLIGANLPDIDVFSYLFGGGLNALAFRRGWTHGVLAMAVLPFVLAVSLMAWEGYRRRGTSAYARADHGRVSMGPLVAVSAVGILSHPLLDLLNNYGVRLLMPFSDRMFYGDSAFIVDPYMLLILISGVWFTRRGGHRRPEYMRPARASLCVLVLYLGTMWWISHSTARTLADRAGLGPTQVRERVMVAPLPARLLSRSGLVNTGTSYEEWLIAWRPWSTTARRTGAHIDIGRADRRAQRASTTSQGIRYLRWSRFPYFVSGVDGDSLLVHLGDARYTSGVAPNWATTRVRLSATDR